MTRQGIKMGYVCLSDCLADLESHGHLRRVDEEIDPHLELAAIQRRLFRAGAPAVLFTRVRGTPFPMLANLFGTRERLRFIFRDGIRAVEGLFKAKADPALLLRRPWRAAALAPGLVHMLPRRVSGAPVLACRCALADLPRLTCWPKDGGPFMTLPLVYTENPRQTGMMASNLGMYRVQMTGNDYAADEVGLHYQIHRGIGVHHSVALGMGNALPVHIFVGGPPSLTVAAVMPLPEGISELCFAGLLGGRRTALAGARHSSLPVLAEADFCVSGHLLPRLKPEGPFGDHLGYYSLQHDFPVLKVEAVHHRRGAVWPFTVVGRPPQEDSVIGDFIHEITVPLVPQAFAGVREVHAVDVAGVHPLLLALGSERYTPYEAARQPRELLTAAMHLLGVTQTALAKYVLLAACEDAPELSVRDVPAFLRHMLERVDFSRDLHFLTRSSSDTLDYTGCGLHEGSKLIWASAGEKKRNLAAEIMAAPNLPEGFAGLRVVMPGVLAVRGPTHALPRNAQDSALTALARMFASWSRRESFPLVVVADDPDFCADNLENFLWVTFTRSDPATDSYGADGRFQAKHWLCNAPLILDARRKSFHAPPLEEDPAVTRGVEALAAPGGALHGYY
ncbi:3-octaprenyl-4-hydroxybenzoate carboxy-lyase [Deltaproteobacteria bacterium]|nr:3-octaprenyl-4-hydroxybenzoate carboxy-lyase [Deltaproteobacteria bacterium]GHU98662.1 3-octaprenyl-4-hydroxybenzoate carboxy-lyase [Deltaproteobacteria bacterium]